MRIKVIAIIQVGDYITGGGEKVVFPSSCILYPNNTDLKRVAANADCL